ncbi:hypothetical protein HNQ36_004414 [Afipia massiliensis]|uniref:Uncharacterized protein n=1 Tax=Afipia massiliensis TaxID=211460 RepID=A0A840N6A6_9BRAD|nr:hypothetical protein [Afipia massiliensis]MBB5054412.1 hypothetical protein [Afipia massiliensis]
MKAVVALAPAIAKAKRKPLPDVNPERASRRPQKKTPAMSPRRHNAEKQATNFSESVRIGIEAAHWPIAEHAS